MEAAAGGILVGLGAGGYMFTHGNTLGCSGFINSVSTGKVESWWRTGAFFAALCGAGFFFNADAFNNTFKTSFAAMSPQIYFLAGLLIGAGTTLANGCTSGHGIVGCARLSTRSIVATAIFVASAFVTVNVMNNSFSLTNLSKFSVSTRPFAYLTSSTATFHLLLLIGLSASGAAFVLSLKKVYSAFCSLIDNNNIADAIITFLHSTAFAFGLGIGGMVVQQNVFGAFQLPTINATLFILFFTGVVTCFVIINLVPGSSLPKAPARSDVDAALIIGAILFGIGWGISGMCPAPMLISLPRLALDFASNYATFGIFVLGVLVGPWAARVIGAGIEKVFGSTSVSRSQDGYEPLL